MPRNGTPNDRTDDDGNRRSGFDRGPFGSAVGSHPLCPTAWGSPAPVLLSAAFGLPADGVLPDRLRIRWSIDTYNGPEFAPTLLLTQVALIVATLV